MLKIGESLQLEPRFSEIEEKYKCRIVDIAEESIYIDYPINVANNKTVFLLDGTLLNVTFVDDDQMVFTFQSEVIDRIRANIPMIQLTFPPQDEWIKIQRRQFVRVESLTDVAVHPLCNECFPFKAVTSDISAGGAAITMPSTQELPIGTLLKLCFVLHMRNGETQYIHVDGRAVRTISGNGTKRKLSVEFVNIVQHDQQVIMRYCFERQLEARRKLLVD